MLKAGVLFGIAVALQSFFKLRWFLFPFNYLGLYLVSGGWKHARIICLTFRRDMTYMWRGIKCSKSLEKAAKEGKSIPILFVEKYLQHPMKTALVNAETGAKFSYADVNILSNQVAHIFQQNGYKKGDCVALIMDGCPEYVCYWLGLAKIGVVTALLNINLLGDSLVHCVKISKAKAIIFGVGYEVIILDIKDKLDEEMEYYCTVDNSSIESARNLSFLVTEASSDQPTKPEGLTFQDKLLYLFTSGTTGLPKAAVITQLRFFISSYGIGQICGVNSEDVIYASLPIYHATGCMAAVGLCLVTGTTLVIRKKFSASRFVDDCIKYDCTVTFYIGEICRYLLNQPELPEDKMHKLRILIGSGLKTQIWEQFRTRFNSPHIIEFYGSTEGCGLMNVEGKVGPVGFFINFIPRKFFVTLVKVDLDTMELIRGLDGFAIECETGEPGELIALVVDRPGTTFEGYLDQKATEKKKIRNVFKKGDTYQRTGDIFVADELGYVYFRDRSGDTFRWKGENVSTAEVETIISKLLNLKDVVVYGVEIPGQEGKAGMVAIADPEGCVDLQDLAEKQKEALPPYARPIFVRITDCVSVTGTHKYQKVDLRKAGYDLSKVGKDKVFVRVSKDGGYTRLDEDLFNEILSGRVRF